MVAVFHAWTIAMVTAKFALPTTRALHLRLQICLDQNWKII